MNCTICKVWTKMDRDAAQGACTSCQRARSAIRPNLIAAIRYDYRTMGSSERIIEVDSQNPAVSLTPKWHAVRAYLPRSAPFFSLFPEQDRQVIPGR